MCVMHLSREGGRKEGIPEKGRYLDQIQNGFPASWAGWISWYSRPQGDDLRTQARVKRATDSGERVRERQRDRWKPTSAQSVTTL